MSSAVGQDWIGADIGGTFTDVARFNGTNWQVAKALSTPEDLGQGVIDAVRRVSQDGDCRPVSRIVHGTTVVANALIERAGASLGLITTAGFRDVLEIGWEPRYDPFDLNLDKPQPLVPRHLRCTVTERIRTDGIVALALDEDSVRTAAETLQEAGCRAVAVVLINAFCNPAHEQQIGALLAREFPSLDVSLSSSVCPEMGEYVRASTTVANAFVRPLVRRYIETLLAALRGRGFAGEFFLMRSNGAIVTPELAAELPVHLLESGTAAGAIAAAARAGRAGEPDIISFDMGGTTAKICVVKGGAPSKAADVEVARLQRFKRGSGLPLRIPVVEMLEIGAGGGSIAHINAMGLLQVGPRSAGAQPGPACYGRGGTLPTVTDADLLLGYLDPDYFLGGEIRLDRGAAERAIGRAIAEPLGIPLLEAARGIAELVNANMANAIRLHTVERGGNPADFTLYAFGGAGPVHAYELARRNRIGRVLCPPWCGIASAIGLMSANPAVEVGLTRRLRLDAVSDDFLRDLLGGLETKVRYDLARIDPAGEIETGYVAEICYAGQGYPLAVQLPVDLPAQDGIAGVIQAAFEATYRRTYGQPPGDLPVEALTWRVTASGRNDAAMDQHLVLPAGDGAALKGHRRVYFPEAGDFVLCPVLERERLRPGERLTGPAVIEERESTAVIGPSGRIGIDSHTNIVIDIEHA